MNLIKAVYGSSLSFLNTVPKSERKKIGQFFTPAPIAEYMGGMATNCYETVYVLDPGAGSGVLSAAIVSKLIDGKAKHIYLDAYENNVGIIPLLTNNLEAIREAAKEKGATVHYRIYDTNFIEANRKAWTGLAPNSKYDIVIGEMVHGQPNLYFLFMAMGAHLLKESGEIICIVPRSFTSGLYFTAFRKWFTSQVRIENVHYSHQGDLSAEKTVSYRRQSFYGQKKPQTSLNISRLQSLKTKTALSATDSMHNTKHALKMMAIRFCSSLHQKKMQKL
ncbi:MAG: N-6 DNA methylase [Eubacteriaceae bacterium]|nr:N-6 DNA methylase [Eubacteriaceae bacterium]